MRHALGQIFSAVEGLTSAFAHLVETLPSAAPLRPMIDAAQQRLRAGRDDLERLAKEAEAALVKAAPKPASVAMTSLPPMGDLPLSTGDAHLMGTPADWVWPTAATGASGATGATAATIEPTPAAAATGATGASGPAKE